MVEKTQWRKALFEFWREFFFNDETSEMQMIKAMKYCEIASARTSILCVSITLVQKNWKYSNEQQFEE